MAIRSPSAPVGGGQCFALLGMRIATGLRPRNDAIVLNGTAIVSMPERLSGPKNSNLSVGLGGDQRDRTADLLNAMAEMLWEIREYTENMEDMERFYPSIFQIAP